MNVAFPSSLKPLLCTACTPAGQYPDFRVFRTPWISEYVECPCHPLPHSVKGPTLSLVAARRPALACGRPAVPMTQLDPACRRNSGWVVATPGRSRAGSTTPIMPRSRRRRGGRRRPKNLCQSQQCSCCRLLLPQSVLRDGSGLGRARTAGL